MEAGELDPWGRPWWPFLGPLQQEEKMEKPPLLGAVLAEVGVSSYLEPVSYDMQRVSRFPSSAGVVWKENLPRFRTRALTFLGNSEWIDCSRQRNRH